MFWQIDQFQENTQNVKLQKYFMFSTFYVYILEKCETIGDWHARLHEGFLHLSQGGNMKPHFSNLTIITVQHEVHKGSAACLDAV